MKSTKGEGLWIRLNHEEREEIQNESRVSGFNMSEIARQRLFNDPIARIDNRMQKLEQRSLTQVACSNLIIELIESLVPKDVRIGKKGIQARLDKLKGMVVLAENIRRVEALDDTGAE